jgi:hypothetical protein
VPVRTPRERDSRGSLGVDRIRLPVPSAGRALGSIDLGQPNRLGLQKRGQTGVVALVPSMPT